MTKEGRIVPKQSPSLVLEETPQKFRYDTFGRLPLNTGEEIATVQFYIPLPKNPMILLISNINWFSSYKKLT